jgi:hypothetical protein
MKHGEKLFSSLSDNNSSWNITLVSSSIMNMGTGALAREKFKTMAHVQLITAINVYNEMYQKIPVADRDGLRRFAEKSAAFLRSKLDSNGALFIAEPGNPRGGEFITLLRESLLLQNMTSVLPCPHSLECPLPASKTVGAGNAKSKWCHFNFDTGDAPSALRKLSSKAQLTKETASISFLLAGGEKTNDLKTNNAPKTTVCRVISEHFPLPESFGQSKTGRYACSQRGLILLVSNKSAQAAPGDIVSICIPSRTDKKTGALIATFAAKPVRCLSP